MNLHVRVLQVNAPVCCFTSEGQYLCLSCSATKIMVNCVIERYSLSCLTGVVNHMGES